MNKVSSKARLRWKLTSGRLAPEVVERFKQLYPSWVTESGDVVITSQVSRDAPKNKAACLEKLRSAIKKAAFKPKKRIPTKPTPPSVFRRLRQNGAFRKEKSAADAISIDAASFLRRLAVLASFSAIMVIPGIIDAETKATTINVKIRKTQRNSQNNPLRPFG